MMATDADFEFGNDPGHIWAIPNTPGLTRKHAIKVAHEYWPSLHARDKTFEVRPNDRGYQRGDVLELVHMDADRCECGRVECEDYERMYRRITYIFSGDPTLVGHGGIVPGFVVLGLGDL